MADVTEALPVVSQTATPQAPSTSGANLTVLLPTIARKARVRRGPRSS